MHGVRRLALITVFSATAVIVVAPAAHAVTTQHCQFAKGMISASPGLSDVPADHTVTLGARLTGCSRTGGSGLLVATTSATQATCANLTTRLAPTRATIVWTNHRVSTVSLTFLPLPGSPNHLAVTGQVLSGAADGDRLETGLHLSAAFTKLIKSANHPHGQQVKGKVPLVGGDCTAANPVGAIKVSSYQSLQFTSSQPVTPTTTGKPGGSTGTSSTGSVGQVTTTTLSPEQAALEAIAAQRAIKSQRTGRGVEPREKPARTARTHVAAKPLASAGSSGSSSGFFDPDSMLGVGCIAAAVALLALLLVPSKRSRRRRRSVPIRH